MYEIRKIPGSVWLQYFSKVFRKISA